ncbi:FAD/FMN-containing isoamyl alcohol oxidase MreA [Acrodontium crateriforme]|uniref:FAD/FMN-containing isoamyl alcohol oxidase MreA n=1 Tax=Acrodontium crateriforme TaxID=150365 RepID=A0AAQ3LZW5_9PEZI|nr:FAD/FMN-containing isoamyl alcohol oxidase MreA [Acrodontium crateriforme]
MKVGAGILGEETSALAHSSGLVVVSGNCPTDVITASGKAVTATPDINSDLYWALAGGGGGTYGIVTSVTVRVYPGASTSTASLNYTLELAGSSGAFWAGIEMFQTHLTTLNDVVSPSQLDELLLPFRAKLETLGIEYTYAVNQFPTYLEALDLTNPPRISAGLFQQGGWLIPRAVLDTQSRNLTNIFRQWAHDGVLVAVFATNASRKANGIAINAVIPAWRTAGINAQSLVFYSDADEAIHVENRRRIRDEYIPALQRLPPESGAYMNGANWQHPNFQRAFYGENYARLLMIKHKYDPDGFFMLRLRLGVRGGWNEGTGDCVWRIERWASI